MPATHDLSNRAVELVESGEYDEALTLANKGIILFLDVQIPGRRQFFCTGSRHRSRTLLKKPLGSWNEILKYFFPPVDARPHVTVCGDVKCQATNWFRDVVASL